MYSKHMFLGNFQNKSVADRRRGCCSRGGVTLSGVSPSQSGVVAAAASCAATIQIIMNSMMH